MRSLLLPSDPNMNQCTQTLSILLQLIDSIQSSDEFGTEKSRVSPRETAFPRRIEPKTVSLNMILLHRFARHVNYRDSKLTRILKPSLCGNARMAVICCVSSSGKYVEETRSTLQFAMRAKSVKTNAVRHEEVEDADLVTKLRLENARAKWENRKLEEQLRRIEKLNHNSLMTERELANLKKFVFGEKPKAVSQRRVDQRLSLATSSLVHDHRSVSMGKTSKDDSCIPSRSARENELYTSSSSASFVRKALSFKAKQVKNLQARIDRLNECEGTKANRDKRYSLISEARCSNVDRSVELIDEEQSQADENFKIQLENYYSQADMVQLESKLANANNLIEGLEHQIDDLSTEKNDALVSHKSE